MCIPFVSFHSAKPLAASPVEVCRVERSGPPHRSFAYSGGTALKRVPPYGDCRCPARIMIHYTHDCGMYNALESRSRHTRGVATMSGVQFIVDEHGHKTAVVIDLRKNAELWEDFYDRVLARSREREPRETLESVKKRLARRKSGSHG